MLSLANFSLDISIRAPVRTGMLESPILKTQYRSAGHPRLTDIRSRRSWPLVRQRRRCTTGTRDD